MNQAGRIEMIEMKRIESNDQIKLGLQQSMSNQSQFIYSEKEDMDYFP